MIKYEKSINYIGDTMVCMASDGTKDVLLTTDPALGFRGEMTDEGFVAELTHENGNVLRKLFSFTAPVRVLSKERSFGLGDRLGIATPAHIRVFEEFDAYPVFVQQSIRELNLTHRRYEDVLDAASFAVFKHAYKKGFGADGDHLKTEEDIRYALGLGFTMITLDCSEHINRYEGQTVEIPAELREKYLDREFTIDDKITLRFTHNDLARALFIYGEAVNFAATIYEKYLVAANADFEISIDETDTPTEVLDHYFVARELTDRGVKMATMAPRFCGEFQKGIDYIGELETFDRELSVHAAIAKHFSYKISVHSGSDKFSIFSSVAKHTGSVWHVKTAGTNWLEAVRVVAKEDPALYREIHGYALETFSEAKKLYHVTTDLSKIGELSDMTDDEFPALMDQNEARQLIHITYGYILDKYKDRLYTLWAEKASVYEELLYAHIRHHLEALNCPLMARENRHD